MWHYTKMWHHAAVEHEEDVNMLMREKMPNKHIVTRRGRADETPMTFVRVNCRMLCWQRGRFKIDIDTCHEIHKLQQLCTTCYPTLTTDM